MVNPADTARNCVQRAQRVFQERLAGCGDEELVDLPVELIELTDAHAIAPAA